MDPIAATGSRLMHSFLSVLPDRYHWEIASRLPVSNLGLPVEADEDLMTSGRRELERIRSVLNRYGGDLEVEQSTVLDIGCGPGRVLLPMAEAGADAYGIDAAAGYLSQCRTNAADLGVDITLARTTETIPDFGTEFDLIYCIKTFQSLPRRLTIRYLQQSFDHLRNGGILYATFPDVESDANLTALFSEEIDDRSPYRNRYFTRLEVRQYLNWLGFREIEFYSTDRNGGVRDQFTVVARR